MAHAVAGRHCTVHKHHPSMGQGAQVTALSLEPPSERTKPPPKSNLDPDRKSYPASSDEERCCCCIALLRCIQTVLGERPCVSGLRGAVQATLGCLW